MDTDNLSAIRLEDDRLFDRVVSILEQVRSNVVRAVNNNMVIAYWLIGREIVQEIQAGEERAEYGKRVIEQLSADLNNRYGRGFSTTNLRYFRTFYMTYSHRIPEFRHIGGGELEVTGNRHTQSGVLATMEMAVKQIGTKQGFSSNLGWSHYRALMSKETRSDCSLRRKALKKENAKSIVIFKNNHFLLSGYTPNTSYSRCRDQ